jgi:hypothetical protein
MFNVGYCGLSTQNMVENIYVWNHRPALVALAPDFTVIYATVNDASNATPVNVFLSNIENIVSDLYSVSNGCLCVGFPYDGISVSNGLSGVEIMDSIDMLFVSGPTTHGCYITKYNATANQMDYSVLANTAYTHTTIADSNAPWHPTISGGAMTVWSEEGMTVLCRIGTTSALNQFYLVPFGAHWDFTNAQGEIISPKMLTPNCFRYHGVSVRAKRQIGDDVHGLAPEPFKTYYRTSGIDDNTGGWTLVDDAGDLSAVAGAASIQFKFELGRKFATVVVSS